MARIEDEIARLVSGDGYTVVSQSERLVVLERKNSWFSIAAGAVVAGLSGGLSGLYRTEHLYLDVDEHGEAVARLSRPQDDR